MTIKELKEKVLKSAIECGMKPRNPKDDSEEKRICSSTIKVNNANANAVIRDNATDSNGAIYFGFIRPEEEAGGAYSDFSLVFFPALEKVKNNDEEYNVVALVAALGVGSEGFKNDTHDASLPFVRRLFMRLGVDTKDNFFFKNDFSDIETPTDALFERLDTLGINLQEVKKKYNTVLPVCEIIDGSNKDNLLKRINCWIATYAKYRNWTKYDKYDKVVKEHLPKPQENNLTLEKIYNVLEQERFIVLQGAPGTGKTYSSLEIAKKFKEHVFFTQFHAETTYSDFVWGIRPKLNSQALEYEAKPGILLEAIEKAEHAKEEKFLLIIDEINRANLSNVLGPVFYLFEKNTVNRDYELKIGDKSYKELPKNLLVIATMNTADRSLAVVDFALRRRFTWITLRPQAINPSDSKVFHVNEFNKFNEIFEKYATDEELNLQPGQSYFITEEKEEEKADDLMKHRLKYELMPLIKEYLNEGYLLPAKDAFSNYFFEKLQIPMYE